MRSSRLVAIVLLLQARGRMTAEALAAELEVSVRTIYRDLEHLGEAGVPVWGERGTGGGYTLLEGWHTEMTGLTDSEAAVVLLSGAPAAAGALGFGALLASARLKLLAAVPEPMRTTAARAEQRFHLDPSGWAHAAEADLRCLEPLAEATWQDRRVRITYGRRGRDPATAEVDPLGLVHKTGRWYLVAGADRPTPRMHRVDRITAVVVTDVPAHRPECFDLAAAWTAWEVDYAASLPRFEAAVRLGPSALRHMGSLGPLAPRDQVDEGTDAQGWLRCRLVFDDVGVACAALLALSPDVVVEGPPELRARMADVVGELACNLAGRAP